MDRQCGGLSWIDYLKGQIKTESRDLLSFFCDEAPATGKQSVIHIFCKEQKCSPLGKSYPVLPYVASPPQQPMLPRFVSLEVLAALASRCRCFSR